MKTFDLSNFPTTETVRILCDFLEQLTKANDHLICPVTDPNTTLPTCPAYTPFHAKSLPNIDIHLYLSRILKYCPCSNECFLALLVYFDRMAEYKDETLLRKRPFAIDVYNVHRLVITGIMVASKFFSDVYYTNVRYAKVGGLPVKELNQLEMEFLRMNEFQMNISVVELQTYADQLLNYSVEGKSILMKNNPILPKSPCNTGLVLTSLTTEIPESANTVLGPVNPLPPSKRSMDLSADQQIYDKMMETSLSKTPKNFHSQNQRSKQNWCNKGFPSQRTDSEDFLGHVASPVH